MKVPTYQRQVGANLPQPAQPSPEASGVGVAQAAGGLGSTAQNVGLMLAQHGIEMQEREDARQTQEAETAFRKALDDLQHNQRNGLLNRQLSDAVGITIDFDKQAEELRKQYLDTLPGKTQKEQFGLASDSHIQAARSAVLRYETDQIRKGEDTAYANALAADFADVARDPSQETLVRKIADATSRINTYGAMRGWTPEMTEAQALKVSGQMAFAAITQQLTSNNIAAAQSIYDQLSGAIKAYSLEKDLQLREQLKKADLNQAQTTLNLLTSKAAAIQSDADLGKLIADGLNVIEAQNKYGFTDDAKVAMRQSFVGGVVTNRVMTALNVEKDPEKAQKILDGHINDMDAPTWAKLQAQISEAGQYIEYERMWDTDLSLLLLSDGTPDENAIYAKLEATYNLQGEQLVRARSYVSQKVSAAAGAMNAQRNATWSTFLDAVDAVIIKGGTKEQAMAVWRDTKFPREHDRLEGRDYIDGRFKPAEFAAKTDLGVWSGLYSMAVNGTCTLTDLQAAARQGVLSDADYKSLFKMIVDSGDTKKNEEQKRIVDYIGSLARTKFAGDTTKQTEFRAFFEYSTKDMSFIEAQAFIQNNKDAWKSHFETTEKLGKEAAKLYSIFDKTKADAVIDGLRVEFGSTVTVDNLMAFETAIGGYTNENQNAILNLYRLKIPITSATVQALISIYPTGLVPKGTGAAGPSAEFWEAITRAAGY